MGKLSDQSKGLIFGVISAVCWGTYGTFVTILTQMGIRQMTVVASIPMVAMVYVFLKSTGNHQRILKINLRILVFMTFHGIVLIDGMNYCYVRAVETVPIGIVAVINFCNVIIVMLASKIFFRYRLTMSKIGAVFGALFGISLILRVFDSGRMFNLAGIGWGACLPILAAISVVLYRYYLNKGAHEDAIIFWVNLFAAVFVWLKNPPWQIVSDISHVVAANPHPLFVLMSFLGLCLVPLAASYYTFFRAYQYIEPTYVSLCYALDPATAAILGFAIFGQRLNGTQLLGIGIVIAAIVYIKIREAKEDLDHEQQPTIFSLQE